MLNEKAIYTKYDMEAIKILEDFLPDKIFDAHAHLYDSSFLPNVHPVDLERSVADVNAYKKAMIKMLGNPKEFRMNIIPFPDCAMADAKSSSLEKSNLFLIDQLKSDSLNVGEIMVLPDEKAEDIEKRLTHPNIRGFKCYHVMAMAENTWNLPINAYLPESAWEIANKRKMCITLHMVKDKALADEENMKYICAMAKKYPDAVLILAHAARSFAAWTAIESVEKVAHLENVWFDFSGICEPAAMFKIMQKAGVSRCMWGSDYPICAEHGKAISIADTFHWIYEKDLTDAKAKPQKLWLIGIENLMAVRQACLLLELTSSKVEDLFYNNAACLWK